MNQPDVFNNPLRSWTERHLGLPLAALGGDPVQVVEIEPGAACGPLVALKLEGRCALAARADWMEQLRSLAARMPMEMIFSPYGCAELARITLPHGYGIWGPTWYLFGDESSVGPCADERPRRFTPEDMRGLDYDLFWHCPPEAVVGFGIAEEGRLTALAVVIGRGDPVWEIGMDVIPEAKGRGLGRAVAAAAAGWVIRKGGLPMATVGPFNVPSVRTLRGVGLRYAFTTSVAMEGPFRIPPQMLGSPLPDAEVYDFYPRWAMNRKIRPRP